MKRRRNTVLFARVALLVIGLIMIGIPFLWILMTAFKLPIDAAASPPVFFSPFTLDNFKTLFKSNYIDSLVNSVIITGLSTGLTLLFGIPAGYAFARGKFRGRNAFGAFLLLSRMVPPVIFIIPLFLFFHVFGLVGTFGGMTLAYLTGLLPFTIWMSASYFDGVPFELEEAARVDGCSRVRTFVSIVMPLALPGVVSVALLVGIAAWSEYFIPLILGGFNTQPATVGIVNFVGVNGSSWGPMAAGALMLIIPVFLATLIAQRSLLGGLTSGAVKG